MIYPLFVSSTLMLPQEREGMPLRTSGALLALALAGSLAGPASAAQKRPSIVIMPTQFFAADAESAKNITSGLVELYKNQNYTIVDADAGTLASVRPDTHYPDKKAIEFGKMAKADLVAYPRLLALGIPAAN